MSFSPSTQIYLCNVPFDGTQKNQIYFSTRQAQQEYFLAKVVKSFSSYLVVRDKLPNGSTSLGVKVEANIDLLRSLPANYILYQNANHGSRFFYAFITDFVYINEETTLIQFKQDVFQTWLLDCEILPSFVEREHSKTDEIGDNIVPEKFHIQDFSTSKIFTSTQLDEYGYIVLSSNPYETRTFHDRIDSPQTGIYQGLFFYYFDDPYLLGYFLDELISRHGECIYGIIVAPKWLVPDEKIQDLYKDSDFNPDGHLCGNILYSKEARSEDITFDFTSYAFSFGGYTPKNNKLYINPYMNILVTNHNGDEALYNIEDFADRKRITFKMCGSISPTPSITLFPLNYKGQSSNYDSGITLKNFAQSSYNADSYKIWQNRNGTALGLQALSGGFNMVMGGVSAVGGNMFGLSQTGQGLQQILGVIGEMDAAAKEPNRANAGNADGGLLTALKLNKFDFYCQRLKKDHARAIDDYFTMFGYQTNKVKLPNLSSRPHFNYVKTIDINITGGIPFDDMGELKKIFDSGVTLWKPSAKFGDYSVDNSPK